MTIQTQIDKNSVNIDEVLETGCSVDSIRINAQLIFLSEFFLINMEF